MKETIVNFVKRIARVFNGTRECHAKLDEAIKRNEEARDRTQSFIAESKSQEIPRAPVANGTSH